MDLIFIYGPPAAGKLTVARELARLTGYRLWDNHVSLDCVKPVFDFGTPSLDRLVYEIRRIVLEEAAEQRVNLITTFVYAHPQDVPYVDDYWRPYDERGGRICPVQLTCAVETLEARIGLESRVEARKLTSVELLQSYLKRYDLFAPITGRESLRLDTSEVEPAETAARIVAHFNLPAPL